MYCSAMASDQVLRWMNSTRSASFSSLRTTEACEMPTEPARLKEAGYQFKHPEIEGALRSVLRK